MEFGSLFDRIYFGGTPSPQAFFLPTDTMYLLLSVTAYATVISILKVLFDDCKSEAYFALVLCIGYGFGQIVKFTDLDYEYDAPAKLIKLMSIVSCQAAYNYSITNGIDFHSVARNLALILSLSLLSSLISILAIVFFGGHILFKSQNWMSEDVFLFASSVLPLEIDATMKELNRAYGQLRSMEQLLLGERMVSLAMSSVFYGVAKRTVTYSSSTVRVDMIVLTEITWMLCGLVITLAYGALAAHVLRKTVDHLTLQVIVTIISPFLVSYYSNFFGFHLTSFYVVILGLYLNSVRPKADPNVERYMFHVWDFLTNTSKLFVYSSTGLLLALCKDPNKSAGDMGVALLFFLMLLFFRSLVHFGIYGIVILKSASHFVTWRQAFLSIWGTYCGFPNLYYGLKSYYSYNHYSKQLLYITIIVLYSQFFNAVLMNYMFSLVGMYDLTKPRIVNMNNCLFKINNCRINSMFSLKLDRIVSDSNWTVVEHITRIPHPYKRTIKNMGGEMDLGDYKLRTITCENCGLTVLAPPSKKELEDSIYEAKLRILKAVMVMLTKQYENGTLSLNCLRVLINLVETATLKGDPVVESSELKITRIGTMTQLRMKIFFAWLDNKMRFSRDFIPKNKVRHFCYNLCVSQAFQLVMVTLTLVDLAILLHLLVDYSRDYNTISLSSELVNVIQMLDIFFYALFATECIVQILGLGLTQYFRNHANKIEFGTNLVVRTCEVILFLIRCRQVERCNLSSFNKHDFQFIIIVKHILVLRVIRFYIFIAALIPTLRRVIDKQILEGLLRNYDMGKAYLMALDRVSKSLSHIVENQPAYEFLKKKMEEDRLIVSKELGQIQREFPSIAATIKTRHAIRHIINTMESCVDDMKEEGVLDHNEHKCVTNAIEDLLHPLRNLVRVEPCPPDFIIKSITWLQDDQEAVDFLLSHAELINFDYNDVIIQQGDDPIGLYVLVSGFVKNIYKPTPTVVQLASKFGVLPNYDFFTNLNFDQQQEEFIGAGNLVGEIGVVTGRRYDMTTICDTSTQVYFIPLAAIKEKLFETEVGTRLQRRIWKSIGVRLAELLFRSGPQYTSGWSKERLFVYLERSFVPNLNGVTRVNFKDYASDVVLIEGVAMDPHTRMKFYGPIHLPRTVTSILLPDHEDWDYQTVYQTQILVIPNENTDMKAIMAQEGVFEWKIEGKRQRGGLKMGKAAAFHDEAVPQAPGRLGKQEEIHHEKKLRVGFRSSSSNLIEEKEPTPRDE